MSTDSLKQNGGEHFFHSLDDFDLPDVVEESLEDDAPPPPPTFSEEEVEAFKRKAFEDGKVEGHKIALDSIEQKSSLVFAQVEIALNRLLETETGRNKSFEHEAVELARHIFETLFPLYQDQHGFDEFTNVLRETLDKRPRDCDLKVSLSSTVLEAVRQKFSEQEQERISFIAADQMPEGECLVEWSQGGAQIDMTQLCEQIRISLDQPLEDRAANGHDGEEKQTQESSDE